MVDPCEARGRIPGAHQDRPAHRRPARTRQHDRPIRHRRDLLHCGRRPSPRNRQADVVGQPTTRIREGIRGAVISTAVVAHETRILAAAELAHALDAVITLDDGSLGAEANHLQAWQATGTAHADWALVLEDDALPVPGFL